jgi:hypothetical protein
MVVRAECDVSLTVVRLHLFIGSKRSVMIESSHPSAVAMQDALFCMECNVLI